MRISLVCLLALLLTAALSANASEGKITVDPNSQPRQAAVEPEPDPLDADRRLDQKVTLKDKHQPVKAILADLVHASGVTLKSGASPKDWQVSDRRMCVFVEDVEMRDLMRSIARVMHFKWSVKHKDGVPIYRLIMDRRTLLDVDTRARQSEDELNAAIKANRKKLIDRVQEMGSMSPAEIEKLRQTNPYLYLIESTGGGKLLRQLYKDSPESLDAMTNGGTHYAMASTLTPAVQQTLAQAIKGRSKVQGTRGGQSYLDDIDKNVPDSWFRVFCKNWGTPSRGERLNELGTVLIKCAPVYNMTAGFFAVSLHDPDSEIENKLSDIFLKADGDQEQLGKLFTEARAALESAEGKQEAQAKELRPGEPEIKHADEDWMQAKADLTGKEAPVKLRDIVERLAEVSGLPVVSDSFVLTEGAATFEPDASLGDVLAKITSSFYYNWNRPRQILELNDRRWLYKRSLQVPAEWIDRWSRNTKTAGALSFDDFVQIATLDDEQIPENLSEDEVLGSPSIYPNIVHGLYRSRPAVRLYGLLTGEQRRLLWTNEGIPFDAFTSDQNVYAQQMIEESKDWGPNWFWVSQKPGLRLRGTLTKNAESGDHYSFAFVNEEDEFDLWSNYTMPKYTPPPPSPETEEGKP